MRHCRRTRGSFNRHLSKNSARNVHPNVDCQVVQNSVRMRNSRIQFCLPVVRFNLRGKRIPVKTQAIFDKLARKRNPVSIGYCGKMRSESSGRSVNFAQILLRFQGFQLSAQTVSVNCQLLSQGSGSCRLSVRKREHRKTGETIRVGRNFADNLFKSRKPYILNSFLYAKRIRKIVNVLACAGKMNKRLEMGKL